MKRAAAILIVLALAACGHRGPVQGTVTDHRFAPAHDEYVPPVFIPGHTSCTPVGKSESCVSVPPIFIPGYERHVADHWSLYLVDGKHKGWRTVSHKVFDICVVGTYCNTKAVEKQ